MRDDPARWIRAVIARGPRDRSQFVVLLALSFAADQASGVCFPKLQWISRHSRMATRSVLRVLESLEEDGWVSVERRIVERHERDQTGEAVRRRGAGNRYRLNILRLLKLESASGDSLSRDTRSGDRGSGDTVACGKPVEGLRKAGGKAVKRPRSGDTVSPDRLAQPLEPLIGVPKRKNTKARAKAGEPAAPLRDGDDDETVFDRRRPVPVPRTAHPSPELLRSPSDADRRARTSHLNREIAHA